MQAQAPPRIGARAGLAAQHQHLAHALLQLLDALRYRRGRDMELVRCTFKTALAHHGGQRFQSCVVKH